MSYSDERINHLIQYAQQGYLKDVVGGQEVRNKQMHTYYHVLKKSDNKKQQVCKYNILNGVNIDMFVNEVTMQKDADHLNSSQVLCYNFFRPLLDNDKIGLIKLLSSYGIQISNNIQCKFEYNPDEHGKDGRLEKTEFDFHIYDQTNGVEVFFEIKYTEGEFGKWNNKSATEENYNNFYLPMVPRSIALKTELIKYDKRFKSDYQLFRNSLRVRSENQYSIFIFPKEDKRLIRQFNSFSEDFVLKKENVQCWYWEDLLKGNEDSELFKKYFL